jgi:hypothetical protein
VKRVEGEALAAAAAGAHTATWRCCSRLPRW